MTVKISSSSSSSPTPSPRHQQTPSPKLNLSTLPPLDTNNPTRRPKSQRRSSYTKNRTSSYSNTSIPQKPSRPPSHIFPFFQSSLPYALVRDFAYPAVHPLHFGPPAETSAEPSGRSTPANELQQRLSDPASASWENTKQHWSALALGDDGYVGTEQLPQMAYGDEHGPPYSEDEDLHSPVVVSSRHKKSKSYAGGYGEGRERSIGSGVRGSSLKIGIAEGFEEDRGYFTGVNGDGSTTYYVSEADEMADGPGGELVTYPPDQARPMLFPHTYHSPRERDPHFATKLPDRSYSQLTGNESPYQEDPGLEPGSFDDSRFSRDYQFTIASPDEEMHGKAVALFDFARENENELPLVEGQVILVSYRHGQGWLVAEDPKTGESGLVPEEYVRLLRDIEGGWSSLSREGSLGDHQSLLSPETAGPDSSNALTPTSLDSANGNPMQSSNGNNVAAEKRPPVVSTFSTSSKDLNPYPHPLLGTQTGQLPPQVVHYGSQTSTPTVLSPAASRNGSGEGSTLRRETSRTEHEKSDAM